LKSTETGTPITVTREIIGGEMWVSIEARDTKMVHKFERTAAVPCPVTGRYAVESSPSCSTVCPTGTGSNTTCPTGANKCPTGTPCLPTCSPFAGSWSMYGTEGEDQFYAAANVPEPIRSLIAHQRIFETIHVNGQHVHIRVCISPVHVHARVHESNFTLGKEHEYVCPFTNDTAKAIGKKESESKWTGSASGLKGGDIHFTREVVNGEMWVTFESVKGKIVRKYERHCQKHEEHHQHK